jgi:hypothetical protein
MGVTAWAMVSGGHPVGLPLIVATFPLTPFGIVMLGVPLYWVAVGWFAAGSGSVHRRLFLVLIVAHYFWVVFAITFGPAILENRESFGRGSVLLFCLAYVTGQLAYWIIYLRLNLAIRWLMTAAGLAAVLGYAVLEFLDNLGAWSISP